jgi:hypothetical protein
MKTQFQLIIIIIIITPQNRRSAGPVDHVRPHTYKTPKFLCAFFRIWFRSSDTAEFLRKHVTKSGSYFGNNIRAPDYRVVGDDQTAPYASDQINVSVNIWTTLSKNIQLLDDIPTKYQNALYTDISDRREHKLITAWTVNNLHTKCKPRPPPHLQVLSNNS